MRSENLRTIARKYGSSVSRIREANADLDPEMLFAGQRLFVPGTRNVPGLVD